MLTLEVAAQARDQVWQRTESLIGGMSAAEAQGYARARATVVVARTTDLVLRHQTRSVSRDTRDQVVAGALEAVVTWVVQQRRQVKPVRRAA